MAFRKVWQFKECSIEYVGPSGGTFKFSTDLPGGAMAQRLTPAATLANTPADKSPKTQTIPLSDSNSAPFEGTLYQPRVEPPPTGVLQLRAGVIWVRPIGVYLDGTLGEFWETLPLSLGI